MPSQVVDIDSLPNNLKQAVANLQNADAAVREASNAATKARAAGSGSSRMNAAQRYGQARAAQQQAREIVQRLGSGILPRGLDDVVFDSRGN